MLRFSKNARQFASDIRNSISTLKNGEGIEFDNLSEKNYFEKIFSGYEVREPVHGPRYTSEASVPNDSVS